jgi:hypothetical protein
MGIVEALRARDSKRLNRALFGAYFEEDIFEQYCIRLPRAMRAFSWRIPSGMLRRNLIFIHVRRAAGTSITRALYGPRHKRHHSMRYYRAVNPAFCERARSFSVLRDPIDRFVSAYFFVRGGGTAICPLARVFADATAGLRGIDDYLSFIEDRDPLELDFVMRPQSWFVCDLQTGIPLVDELFLFGEQRLMDYLRFHGVTALPHLNPSERQHLMLSSRQKSRIERLYAQDFVLFERVAHRCERLAAPGVCVAAE